PRTLRVARPAHRRRATRSTRDRAPRPYGSVRSMPKEQDFHLAFKRALAEVSPRVVTLDETRSTNDDARALARAGAPHMTVVVADTQSAARGRLGRNWTSDPKQ